MVTNTHKKAFTLIELLVVISIIALLLSIVMPALTKVKEKAKRTVCRSNLMSLGKAFYMYGGDWNDTLPPFWEKDSIGRPQLWPNKLDCLVELGPDGEDRGLIYPHYIEEPDIFFCPNNNWVEVPRDNPLGWKGWEPAFGGFNVTLSFMYLGGGQPFIENEMYNIGRKSKSPRKFSGRGGLPLMQDLWWDEYSGDKRIGANHINHIQGGGRANAYTSNAVNLSEADGCNVLLLGGSVEWRNASKLAGQGIAVFSTTRMFYATE